MLIHGDVVRSLVPVGGCKKIVLALLMHSDIPPMQHGTSLHQLAVELTVQHACCDHACDTQYAHQASNHSEQHLGSDSPWGDDSSQMMHAVLVCDSLFTCLKATKQGSERYTV